MEFFEILEPVTFGAGQGLCLSPRQLDARAGLVDVVDHDEMADEYYVTVRVPVAFKAGEMLGIDGAGGLPRVISAHLKGVATDLEDAGDDGTEGGEPEDDTPAAAGARGAK